MAKTSSQGSPATTPRADTTTRVDTAHNSENLGVNLSEMTDAPLELLQAIAGHDIGLAPQQLRSQALELAAILRDKQQTLEQRESELNARTAQLENEVRTARLKAVSQFHHYAEESLLAHDFRPEPPTTRNVDERVPLDDPSPEEIATANSHGLDFDFQREHEELQRQRAELQDSTQRITQRQQHVEALYDEVLTVHRETLEIRLATEQVWAQLLSTVPRDDLAVQIAEWRAKLADHYRLAGDALTRRTEELHREQQELHLQDQRLRQQRRELQLWADRRYDELEARTAQLVARERELDHLESEFQRQSWQWQQQRETYRQQIEQLSAQFREMAPLPPSSRR